MRSTCSAGCEPFAWAFWKAIVAEALVETFHTATLGTIIALLLSVPVALMAARSVRPSLALNLVAKFILVASRSVNSPIRALLFVAIFGPGALAGMPAIAFRSIGFVGKLLAEALEEAQRGPIEALTAAGAPPTSILLKGYWPQVERSFWSVALYRWDINVRESVVLGPVGAGGIGIALDTGLSNLCGDRDGPCLFAIFIVVIVTEIETRASVAGSFEPRRWDRSRGGFSIAP